MKMNGIDLVALQETGNVLSQYPELAKFTFRTNSNWSEGAKTRIRLDKYSGTDDDVRTGLYVDTDEPGSLLGTGKGFNPIELLLAAISACLTVGFSYGAAGRGIRLHHLSFALEGDIDLLGFMDIDKSVRPGCNAIRIQCEIAADATDQQLEDLRLHVQRTSPLLDSVAVAVKCELNVTRVPIDGAAGGAESVREAG